MQNATEQDPLAEAAEETQLPIEAMLKPRAWEIFRGLWASLFYAGRTKDKTFLICSADRREGASTIACGLALAGTVPSGGSSVALVDFNLRHPVLHEMLNMEESPGVGEILLDSLPPKSAVQRVNDGLDLYAIGYGRRRILDILRDGTFAGFFSALSKKYDQVLVDVAPVNHFPDAQVLAGVVENIVLVAHTQQTPREAVAQAKKRIEAGGGKVVGLVLNLRTYPIPRFLYRRV